ncbi:glycoside hydrolase family 3 N-terminal domain-containing protein [Nocardioides sp. 503]|uniref:glycoside hydrolase family 3 N-terminal domain-containing protein n=1 Tax=Nocardioides sp. 503 TaxID=2508326 RepID=UPI00106F5FE6|nr:glycoside hydrolase family 3 N-terminal domain-containing protein [Nocardioides sp. 503]
MSRDRLERLALAVQLPGFPGTTLADDVRRMLADGLGGICLFAGNTADGPDAVARLVADVHATADGAVVATDEEGGSVTRLHVGAGSPVLGPAALGVVDDPDLTAAAGRAVGHDLAALGIDLCLGPVADVNSNPDNPVIGVRSFGSAAGPVAAHVAAWVGGLQSTGPAACVKHFPGHGDTAVDSHLALPVLEADLDLLARRELVPFAAAVEAGAAAVMTSHLVVRALDPDRPATTSPPVLAHLRERLGFEGVVVTDALDMVGVSGRTGVPEAAVLALAAGADLLCLGADKDPALVRAVQSAIVEAVRGGRIDEERLADAAARATSLRRRGHRGPAGHAEEDEHAQSLAAPRSLVVDGTLPDLAGAVLARVDTAPSIAVGPGSWGLPTALAVRPDEAGAATRLTRAAGGRPLVLQVRDAHLEPATARLVADLAATTTVVVVELGWPGPLPVPVTRIRTHGVSRPTHAALARLLSEKGWSA